MHCVIYLRVSSEQQVDGYSLAAQERGARQLAVTHGLIVDRVYSDDGQSGKSADRDAFQAMLYDLRTHAKRRNITAVIIHKLDRFMRDLRLTLNFEAELRQLGIRLMTVVNPIDTNSPEGRLQFQLEGAVAEWYRNNLGREVKKGLSEKAAQGRWVGNPPFGYRVDEYGILQPNQYAPSVRQIFELYQQGRYSFTDIADILNAEGQRVFIPWKQQTHLFGRENIRGILRNRAYAGFVMSSGIEYPGLHEPLISLALWEQCRQIREVRERKRGRVSLEASPAGGLLADLLYCDVCGSRMWFHRSTGRKKKQWCYYVCSGRSRRTCDISFVSSLPLEAQALAIVKAIGMPSELQARALAIVKERHTQPRQRPAIDRSGIEATLKRYALIYADGLISDSEYMSKKMELQRQLTLADQPDTPQEIDFERVVALLSSMATLIEYAEPDELRGIFRTLFDACYVEEKRIIKITPTALYLPLVGVMERLQRVSVNGVAKGARTLNILSHSEALCH